MASLDQTITITRGEDDVIVADFETDDPTPTIAGWSIAFAVAEKAGGTVKFQKTVGNGITIIDPIQRIIAIQIPFADTNALLAKKYAFDCWRTDPGTRDPLAHGTLVVRERVATLS